MLRRVCQDETIALVRGADRECFVEIPAVHLVPVVQALQRHHRLHHLSAISGLVGPQGFQVLYHLWLESGLTLRVACPRQEARLPTITGLLPAANWYEAEIHDLLGIDFVGHPDLTRLILPEGWEGPPPMLEGREP